MSATEKAKAELFDENAIVRTIKRISHEILEKNENIGDICLIGIKTRGYPLAQRISECIFTIEGVRIPTGMIDITLFRDDISGNERDSSESMLQLPFDITGKTVILTDDVLFTGRSVRAALDAIMKQGRPAAIRLAVLVDRGHRELPIRPDYVGKNIPTSRNEFVRVMMTEYDGTDRIDLLEK